MVSSAGPESDRRGKKTLASPFLFLVLDQVLKCRVKVSLHGAWTESQCAGKMKTNCPFLTPVQYNVSWFQKCLHHKTIFLKTWIGELEHKASIFSPCFYVFSFQYALRKRVWKQAIILHSPLPPLTYCHLKSII